MVAMLLLAPVGAAAQVTSVAASTPVLSPVGLWRSTARDEPVAQANSLTLIVNSGAAQAITSLVDNRINNFPSPVNITTEWELTTLISSVDLVGYFAAPSAALIDLPTGNTLPSSRVLGRMSSGRATAFTAFTQGSVNGVGTPGGSLHLFRQWVIGPLNGIDRRTDNLDLQLDLRGIPNLAPGTYRGTLTLRAVAY